MHTHIHTNTHIFKQTNKHTHTHTHTHVHSSPNQRCSFLLETLKPPIYESNSTLLCGKTLLTNIENNVLVNGLRSSTAARRETPTRTNLVDRRKCFNFRRVVDTRSIVNGARPETFLPSPLASLSNWHIRRSLLACIYIYTREGFKSFSKWTPSLLLHLD